MPAKLKIQDGNPIWMSSSIIPSKNRPQGTQTAPGISAINQRSSDVKVYVKVENNGTEDFGVCPCSQTGPWLPVNPFSGYRDNYSGRRGTETFSGPNNASVFIIDLEANTGDILTVGATTIYLGANASKRWAWAWSPDGNLFAYVYSSTPYYPGNPSSNPIDWNLVIVALTDISRYDESQVTKGREVCRYSGNLYAPNMIQAWNASNFGWAKSNAVIVSGAFMGQYPRNIISPYSPNSKMENLTYTPNTDIEWQNVVSPCGSMVACMPKKRVPTAPDTTFEFVSTISGERLSTLKLLNVPIGIPVGTGDNPSITTIRSGAGGLKVKGGDRIGMDHVTEALFDADDPDCTFVGGGVRVRVDRVRASTLPSANLGVVGVGEASLSTLEKGKYAWVEVPQMSNWVNQREPHWCLLAQAYTTDGVVIQKPWNGQAMMPLPFPVNFENCAQRNIEISN